MRNVPSATQIVPVELRLIVNGVDLSDRVQSWERSFDFDGGCYVLDVTFTNHEQLREAGLGLDPRDPNSTYNATEPLLGAYHEVTLDIRKQGVSEWTRWFTGFVGPAEVSGGETWGEADTVSCTCVGKSQPLKDWMIEDRLALKYENAIISPTGSPDLLNRILQDQELNYSVVYRDDPDFSVSEYIVSGVSAWEALENALAPTGFRLVELWNDSSSDFEITVVDPMRSKTEPDFELIGGFSSRRLSGSEADVRTYVAVAYRDFERKEERYVWAEADSSIVAKYGIPDGSGGRKHRKMVYKTQDRSLIDSESEARELAALILHDLQEPTPDCEIRLPYLDPRFEPFDLVRFTGEYSVDVGVMSVRESWSFERQVGETVISGTANKIIGAKQLWLSRDAKRQPPAERRLQDMPGKPPPQPPAPELDPAWYVGPDGTPQPVVDAIFPGPVPWWAKGRVVAVGKFKVLATGTASGGTMEYLEDTDKSWEPGQFSGKSRDYLYISSGTGAGQTRRIKTNTATRIYVETAFDMAPSSDSVYVVLRRLRNRKQENIDLSPFYRVKEFEEGSYVFVAHSLVPSGR